MNRDIYRLVRNQLDQWVPAPETSRGNRKGGSKARQALLATMLPLSISSVLMAGTVYADNGLPTPCSTCGGAAAFVAYGQAAFARSGNVATVSQVGDKAILNWRDFNVAKGNSVIFQQVSDLLNLQAVSGASFSTLNRIWDADPSVIAGQIRGIAGQSANLMLINQNGIVFANGAAIDVNSLTASSLDIKDTFFKNQLTPLGNTTAQFENGLDGNPNTGGFIKVMEGARLTAASGGKVMLIAPTVTNRGTIETPNGQTILAAGNKVFLAASSDPKLRGLLVEVDNANLADGEYDTANGTVPATVNNPDGSGTTINVADGYDKLGNATNLGVITAAKGNVTMVGLAVNQMNRASASTSLQMNGSIYLMAKSGITGDLDASDDVLISSSKAGRVVMGQGSRTEVSTEVNDLTKSKESFTHSNIEVIGKQIVVERNAAVVAPSGTINLSAVLDPSSLKVLNKNSVTDPFLVSSNSLLEPASIRIESGALLDVSGLDVTVPVSDNYLKIKLLGDELSNSPINRNNTALRGQEVWVDLVKGSPLIANIADYQKNIERTVAYGSTAAGSVNIKSQGDAVIKPDATIDLSGGKVAYSAAQVNETKLMGADGKVYDMATAPADMRYVGIANQYTKDYGRWGIKETFNRSQTVYNAGYVEGSNAGTLSLNARQAYFAGSVDGSTTVGLAQAQAAKLPLTALLQIGSPMNTLSGDVRDYGLNQNVLIGAAPSTLADDFGLSSTLSADQQANFRLDGKLLGGSGFNRVELYTNQALSVDKAVNLAAGGSFKVTATNVQLNADVKTPSGNIEANARGNIFQAPLSTVSLADGVTLSAAGGWINDIANGNSATPRLINAGSVKLTGDTTFGQDSLIDVRGGAYRSVAGKVTAGKGGDVTINALGIHTPDALQNHFAAESLGTPGTLDVTTLGIQIGGGAPAAGILRLDTGFFNQGFTHYNLSGQTGVTLADNTSINVRSRSLELLPTSSIQATGTAIGEVTRVVTQTDDLRAPANINLAATNLADQLATLTIGTGSQINTDTGGKVALSATKSIEINGRINAPAGTIDITLDKSSTSSLGIYDAAERIHLGNNAVIAATGAAKVYPNSKGLRVGGVLAGGTVNLTAKTGYVDAEQGALIDVHGAAPVQLDIANISGGMGQAVASDAGSVNVIGEHGVFLDNRFNAQAGSADRKGGSVLVQAGFSDQTGKVAHVGSFANTSPSGLQGASQIGHAYADVSKLQAAGFERLTVRSNDKLVLEGDVAVGQATGKTLQSIKLDAPNIESSGGNASLKASIVQLGNTYVAQQATPVAPVNGTGTLAVQADLIELLGQSSFSGFSTLNLVSHGEVRLTGVQPPNIPQGVGGLTTTANINITSSVVSPASLTTFTLSSADSDIHFYNATNSTLTNPLSVMGNVKVAAKNIYQDGRIVAPFGNIDLQASETLQLGNGSVTSVAADAGSVKPLGMTLNGLSWFIDSNKDGLADDVEQIKSLPVKSVKLDGKDVAINSGAKVDLSGGGDIQAIEFSSGPGGLIDLLAPIRDAKGNYVKDVNGNFTYNYYAILPGYTGIAAPADPQPGSFNLSVGQSVYLAGGNGLKAGNYTLLPAQYALLPGAYAIKLSSGVPDVLPINAYSKADGTHVIAGFLTDNRFTPTELNSARWTGYEVLNRDEVRQRSEYNLTSASSFFAKDGVSSLPADAGLLAIKTIDTLVLNGQLSTAAGAGGKGAAVDISAAKLAIVDGTTAAADEVALDVKALNALNADSLLIGALREKDSSNPGVTKLNVGASSVRMDTVSSNGRPATALKGREVMLAATDQIALEHESTIISEGAGGNAGTYSIEGNAAFVRVAATDAKLEHTGSIDRSTGNLSAAATSKITSARSVILDATNENSYQGQLAFSANGLPIAGSLSIGANRINFGNVPGGTTGLVFDSNRLASLNGLDEAILRSYSSFDFYRTLDADGTTILPTTLGNKVGGQYSINNLSLQGGGLRGMGDAADAVNIQAKTLQISNPDAIAAPDATLGSGNLVLNTDKLITGAGDKAIIGFAQTTANATEVLGQGAGKLSVDGALTLNTARISGESGARQALESTGSLLLAQAAATSLPAANSIGAGWAFKGSTIDFDTLLETHSGKASFTATTGDLTLTQNAKVDVSGQPVSFFDQTRAAPAGTVSLTASNGNVNADSGARIDVSAAAGGNGGQLIVSATQGVANIAQATLLGTNAANTQGVKGQGASVSVDAQTVTDFNALNSQLNSGGFAQAREFRLRSGDLALTQAGADAIKAHQVSIAVDAGRIDVSGEINASGQSSVTGAGGNIGLYAKNGVTLTNGANLHAEATTAGAKGGKVTVATTGGTLDLQSGSQINVGNSAGAASGEVLLRAPRTGAGAGNGVAVGSLAGTISGAFSTVLEAVKTYTGVNTVTTGSGTGSTLGFTTIANDVNSFMGNKSTILSTLGKAGDSSFHLRAGAEVRSNGNLTVGADWNLYSASRTGDEPGTLTLRAANNLNINGSLSDGFVAAASNSAIGTGESWSYHLVAGADSGAANPLAVNQQGAGDFVLAQNKLIRTGTGDIEIAAAGDFKLGNQKSVIYTAGSVAPVPTGFNATADNVTLAPVANNFTQNGGDISIAVNGLIQGAVSNQLYSNWLFRQGKTNANGAFDASNPQTAWWVRFDQFEQGIGALGGGNVSVKAAGDIENLSVSSVTNGRMAAATPVASQLLVLGGGDVSVQSGKDIKGGQFYVAKGNLNLAADGAIQQGNTLYSTIALGDAKATISARGDVNLQAVINPTLVAQSTGSNAASNIRGNNDIKRSFFSTYTDDSAVSASSLNGNLVFHNDIEALKNATSLNLANSKDVLTIYPGSFKATAFNGNVQVKDAINMSPAARGELEILAQNNVLIDGNINMSDAEQSAIPTATQTPTNNTSAFSTITTNIGLYHALTPVHAGDTKPVLVYAVGGDIAGTADQNKLMALPKAAHFIAGRDFANLGVVGQNIASNDVTSIKTGRDLKYTNDAQYLNELKLGGPGRFDFEVGRNLDLAKSAGISTTGDLANNALARDGASIQIAVGVPKGVDYAGTVSRLIDAVNVAIASGKPVSDSTLWQARWLTGDEQLASAPATLLNAVTAIQAQGIEAQRQHVRSMFYQALRDTGRDYNNPDSPYVGKYDRGYDTIALLFPDVDAKNADGSSKNYDGQLNLALSSIKTKRGGDIEYLAPGGGALIGLAQISDAQLPPDRKTTDLGIVSLEKGAIRGFTRDDMLVNQSRILTVGGGDILLWSSEGDLDAGKGKRTASSVPPPIVTVDKVGNVVVILQGAATGSGIGALGDNAGDVDLIAPKGTVNAGDAGVRARNVNIAAQTVLNAGNIAASGSATGTQVADAGALGGTIAGASGIGSEVAKNVANDVARNAAQAANSPVVKPVIPSLIDVEVISIGQ